MNWKHGGPRRRVSWTILSSLVALALICVINAGIARAQGNDAKWPDRPVHFIVPFPAGSVTDIVARIVGQKLSTKFGQQFVIENRPGASGEIGTGITAHATPDGYTIGLATSSTHVIAASLNPKLSYDPVNDFAQVSMLGTSPYVLSIYPGLPVHNVAELIALAKAKPRTLDFASAGPASLAHIAGNLFSRLAGIELTEVSYRSSAQSVLDLTEGRIQIQFGTLAPTLGQIHAGKVRALAVTGPKRVAVLPDLPTLQEAGLKDYDIVLWLAVVMPAGSPPAIVSRLNQAIQDSLADKNVVATLNAQGVDAEPSTPDVLRDRIRTEIVKFRKLAATPGQ
jgi:tripartite-type tricarboxylate transporter receptor subunit TctC